MLKDTGMAGHQAICPQRQRNLNATNPENSYWKHIDEESSELFTLFVEHSLGGGRDEGRRPRLILSLSMELGCSFFVGRSSEGYLVCKNEIVGKA